MTIAMYARRKQWALERITVFLRHSRIHAEDCAACETRTGTIGLIERVIELEGVLDEEQRARLLAIANRRPVHMTLTTQMHITTKLAWGASLRRSSAPAPHDLLEAATESQTARLIRRLSTAPPDIWLKSCTTST
jgi:hypothetical protein